MTLLLLLAMGLLWLSLLGVGSQTGQLAVFGAANATAVLQSRALTLILLHNRYCADCQRLRQQLGAAAALHAASASGDAYAASGGFAETDIGQSPGLLQAFALRELPALRIHRSADNLTWEYGGGLAPHEMAAHMHALVRSHAGQPRPLRGAADLDALTAAATHVALVVGGPGARQDGRVAELLRSVAEFAAVRELEPTGLATGALADGGRLWGAGPAALRRAANSTAAATPALSLALLQLHDGGGVRWFGWQGRGWPSAAELASWVAAHAVRRPPLVELSPHSLTDELLEELRNGSPPTALLIGFGSTEELAEGGELREALQRAAAEYSGSLTLGYLDHEAWPELARRLRGSRSEHGLMVIDMLKASVMVERQPPQGMVPTASDADDGAAAGADVGSVSSWLRLRTFAEKHLRDELTPLSELPFHDDDSSKSSASTPPAGAATAPPAPLSSLPLSSAQRGTRDAEALLGAGWAGGGGSSGSGTIAGHRSLRADGVRRLYAADFRSTSLRDTILAEQGANASVPTLVAFLLPWCGFSIQVEPLLEELAAVARLAALPVNVMRYDVTPTNPLPEHLIGKLQCSCPPACLPAGRPWLLHLVTWLTRLSLCC